MKRSLPFVPSEAAGRVEGRVNSRRRDSAAASLGANGVGTRRVWVLLSRKAVRAGASVRFSAPEDEPTVDGEIRREVGT